MPFKNYFQSELTALRQDGKRFSERNPALAPLLGSAGEDPDVDRLLEGVAFLTGRLRQKIDDDLPELTHSLMTLLWPNYMRPLPAFSMVEFAALPQGQPLSLPRDSALLANEVQGINCSFRSSYDVSIDALQLKNASYNLTPEGVALTVQLTIASPDTFDKLPLQQLRLHLTGEKYISQTLYIDLLHYLTRIDIRLLDKSGKPLPEQPGLPALSMGSESVLPVGFAEQHALIPDPLNTFRGYRILQEYFSFPDKFQFVDLTDFEWLGHCSKAVLEQAHGLELRFIIVKSGALELPVAAENIRLHCTPVVNLFKQDADPISQDGKQDRYEVRPQQMDRRHCGVYSIDKVSSRDPALQTEEICVQFESFEHDHSSDADNPIAHYSVHQQPANDGLGLDTYLSFSPRHDLTTPVISIELTCTNQDLPAQIPKGGICLSGSNTPNGLVFSNIVVPTRSYAPPTHKNYFWKLISNLSLNYLSLVSVNPLRVILETYDLPRYYDQQAAKISRKKLEGLVAISHSSSTRLFDGVPMRGVRTELVMNPNNFECEGAMYFFACVLNEFFALYTSINSYHQLQVKSTEGQLYSWPARMGQQALI